MGDQQEQVNWAGILHTLAEGQRGNQEQMNHLVTALGSYTVSNQQTLQGIATATGQPTETPRGGGPRPREPRNYDGDRTNGKLDDHLRDLRNWVMFYDARNQWASEEEKVRQCAGFLTGKMHRLYEIFQGNLQTFPQYCEWLQATFRDPNEQLRLRDEWQATIQDGMDVNEYVANLIYIGSRIQPPKSQDDIKEQFRTGLDANLRMKMLENPDIERATLEQYVALAGRYQQIEYAKQMERNVSRVSNSSYSYAIFGNPRRGIRRESFSRPRRPAKNTDEWREWCKRNDACFDCGSTEHQVRNHPRSSDKGRSPSLGGGSRTAYPRGRAPTPARGRPGSRSPSSRRSFSRDRSQSRNRSRDNTQRVAFTAGKDRVQV